MDDKPSWARRSGMDTAEILARLESSSVDDAILDGLRITVERLCSQYPFRSAGQLLGESRVWLSRTITMLDRKLSIAQRRGILSSAGWLAALTGCLEYDCANRKAAKLSCATTWNLGKESGNADVMAWSQEMRAWFALTAGDYRGVLDAAETGLAVAPRSNAAAQLHAQKAKAWARLGDRCQVEAALDHCQAALDQLPHPENPDNHFAIDPAKWNLYCMDCYRVLGSRSPGHL
jgi:tetratricopeptide (TPR) repeat protein